MEEMEERRRERKERKARKAKKAAALDHVEGETEDLLLEDLESGVKSEAQLADDALLVGFPIISSCRMKRPMKNLYAMRITTEKQNSPLKNPMKTRTARKARKACRMTSIPSKSTRETSFTRVFPTKSSPNCTSPKKRSRRTRFWTIFRCCRTPTITAAIRTPSWTLQSFATSRTCSTTRASIWKPASRWFHAPGRTKRWDRSRRIDVCG